jgi:hypothetical protein
MFNTESTRNEKTLEQLCMAASREQNGHTLMDLVEEIDRRSDEQHKWGPQSFKRTAWEKRAA